MTKPGTPVPQWLLERLALGELDAAAAADVRRRLAEGGQDPEAVLAGILASNAELLAAHPPSRLVPAIRRRSEMPASRAEMAASRTETATSRAGTAASRAPRALWVLAPAALAGALALVLWARPAPEPPAAAGLEPTTLKGSAGPASRLLVYRHQDNGDRALADGARAAEGDLVQLAYRERGNSFGLLLSIDGGGSVTLHWPEQGAESARLQGGGEARLPSAYQLDAAPGFERFFLVTAARPFPVAPVMAAAQALAARPADARRAPLPLPPSFEQTSIALDKPGAPAKELR